MFDLSEACELVSLSVDNLIREFDCGNADLNDFFINDAMKYQQELLGQTYFFRLKEEKTIVAAFTLSNDSIKVYNLPNARKKKVNEEIPAAKRMKSYPATLIGRLGVVSAFARKGIGTQVLDFIKSLCLLEDANKCRFVLVDAYNNLEALGLYKKNEFDFVFSTEEQEKEYYDRKDDNGPLRTRFMYFDLLLWVMQNKEGESE